METGSRTRVTTNRFEHFQRRIAAVLRYRNRCSLRFRLGSFVALTAFLVWAATQPARAQNPLLVSPFANPPPRVEAARRFLSQRGWPAHRTPAMRTGARAQSLLSGSVQSAGSIASWQPLGPGAVSTAAYGLVTGRISAIALDPADPTGNRVYIGTTGGGVWLSQNAGTSNSTDVRFVPLTDYVGALNAVLEASISIGALSVQPGGTGVVLAGTGDTNDALDSYYGSGLLRSTDGGNSWSLIPTTADHRLTFLGEGFAGFAWSTANQQVVVAAVSRAYEGTLNGALRPNASYQGLYYSTDSGATWFLAHVTDPNGRDVQGPNDVPSQPDGNAVTSVEWNPVRQLFLAAVRYHGYYQSADGTTWTRLTVQPANGLTMAACPTNTGEAGSPTCPIDRGTIAVNPLNGDTFAWTVNTRDQDQGIWHDSCAIGAGVCSSPNITFTKQWSTAALETNDPLLGPATIENGGYTLALAAIPSGQDTVLLAGTDDLWQCALAGGCTWSNTTNAFTCKSAQVAGYQHALAWSLSNPSEIFIGNDSGLWRSIDGIAESGPICNASDATHFQNLNAALGSLAEVESLSPVGDSPYTLMAGLGANGTAGVKSMSGPTSVWPQILDGEGGPVAIDPANDSNWYVNNQAGVSIHRCSETGDCTPAAFGASPAVTNADVSGDGNAMSAPAPFLVDPLDSSQLLIGTCRVWRGSGNGGWSGANAISPFLDGARGKNACNGDGLIRSMAAIALPGGREAIYAGMYGAGDGGATVAGHVFGAIFDTTAQASPVWQDLTLSPVTNDTDRLNAFGKDISSIFIDPHDTTGKTVYVTVEGIPEITANVRMVYRSTDGGAHWQTVISNLPPAPANSLVVDPADANTVYVATDMGVFSTRQIGSCLSGPDNCWSAYGTGLPGAPVTQLSAAPTSPSSGVLVAGTYGRGIWQIPLWTSGMQLTSASLNPTSLTFSTQSYGSAGAPQAITVTNTGASALAVSSVAVNGDFSGTDNCQNASIGAGGSCTVQVTFTPTQAGQRTGLLTITANLGGGQLSASLTGTGTNPTGVSLSPTALSFGRVPVGASSDPLQVTVENPGAVAVSVANLTVPTPFALLANACGSSLAANSDCQLLIKFSPTQAGPASGTLQLADSAGTQTAALTGTGAASPTDALSTASLSFPATIAGQNSAAQAVSLTNSGGMPLTGIAATTSGPFQVSSNCTAQLAANSSCALSVVFSPTASGAQTGTLTVSDALRTQQVALAGTGLQPPSISVNPAALIFPTQAVGVASAPGILSVTNGGGTLMANVGFQIAGPSAASFSIGATSCGATLANGSSCSAQILFTPIAAGGAAATLTVSSSTLGVRAVPVALTGTSQASAGINVTPGQMTFAVATLGQSSAPQIATVANTSMVVAQGLALSVAAPYALVQNTCGATLGPGANCSAAVIFTPSRSGNFPGMLTAVSNLNAAALILSGSAGAPSVGFQPSLLNFPTTGVGATSVTQSITVTNTGAAPLDALSLAVSNGFQLASTTCTASLSPAASCVAAISFSPAAAGPQSGNFAVASGALAAPTLAPLSGIGFDFAATPSGNSTMTVSSGQNARFTLALSPSSGSSGTFTFSCGSLPSNAACSFNPASETIAANNTGSVTVLVATGVASNSSRLIHPPGWAPVATLWGLCLLPLACWRKRKPITLAILLVILAGAVSSCSGSGGGTGGTPTAGSSGNSNTPPGTYTILVNVTSNGVVHQVAFSLTVD